MKSSIGMMHFEINSFFKKNVNTLEDCYIKPVCPLVYVTLIRLFS